MIVRVHSLILTMCFLFARVFAHGQISDVHIGVNGLTCSQCTRNVEMSLRKLSFVQDVKMDLQHTDGIVTLKSGTRFDANAIAKAVRAAGFSLRFLKANIDIAGIPSSDKGCFFLNGDSYQIVPIATASYAGNEPVQFVGESFLPPGEWKKWKPQLAGNCFARNGTRYFITHQTDRK